LCLTGGERFLRVKEREHPYVVQHCGEWEDPERLLEILIDGHTRLTREIAREARALGLRRIVVDQRRGLQEVYGAVKAHCGID